MRRNSYSNLPVNAKTVAYFQVNDEDNDRPTGSLHRWLLRKGYRFVGRRCKAGQADRNIYRQKDSFYSFQYEGDGQYRLAYAHSDRHPVAERLTDDSGSITRTADRHRDRFESTSVKQAAAMIKESRNWPGLMEDVMMETGIVVEVEDYDDWRSYVEGISIKTSGVTKMDRAVRKLLGRRVYSNCASVLIPAFEAKMKYKTTVRVDGVTYRLED